LILFVQQNDNRHQFLLGLPKFCNDFLKKLKVESFGECPFRHDRSKNKCSIITFATKNEGTSGAKQRKSTMSYFEISSSGLKENVDIANAVVLLLFLQWKEGYT
jgi:hypothetical protein